MKRLQISIRSKQKNLSCLFFVPSPLALLHITSISSRVRFTTSTMNLANAAASTSKKASPKTKASKPAAGATSTTEEDEKFSAYVKETYRESVRKVTSCLQRKGVYRVTMEWTGEVLSVKKCKLSVPGPNEFFIVVRQKGKLPNFGNFRALTEQQRNVAGCIRDDIVKIGKLSEQTREIAATAEHAFVEKEANKRVQELQAEWGTLPESDAERQARVDRKKKAEMEKKRKEIEDLMKELDEAPSFEDLMKEEKLKTAGGNNL